MALCFGESRMTVGNDIATPFMRTDGSLYANLIQALPHPVLVVSPDLRVVAANDPARETLPALRIGGPLVLALRDPTVLDAIRRVNLGGEREIVRWRDRVPIERTFEVTVAAIVAGEATRIVVLTINDLTEVYRIERMRADFIANASHELRTPLASLLGFVETLQGPARDDARARDRFLGIMADQARRMARLVDDLLSLSRIEQKRHIKPSAVVDLSTLTRHVAETLNPLAKEQGLLIKLSITPGVTVAGDRDELVRVAENLIENAIKYGRPAEGSETASPDRNVVDVSVALDRDYGVLAVRDRGDGIAPEHLPRLTERFYRTDAGQSRAKGGTGLGLALVKHIIAHHRGRFDFDSTLGQGSVFMVKLPTVRKSSSS